MAACCRGTDASPRHTYAHFNGKLDRPRLFDRPLTLAELAELRSGAVPAPKLTSLSYVHRHSLDVPFIHEVNGWCGLEGFQISTHETPLASEADARNPMPGDSAPLERSAAMAACGLGAKVFLTGQNGDLVMGNWFDDSLQVAIANDGSIADGILVARNAAAALNRAIKAQAEGEASHGHTHEH